MWIGLVVYGGLDGTSGGYRYDRELVTALEQRGDEVDIVSIPPPRDDPSHADDRSSLDGDPSPSDEPPPSDEEPTPPIRERLDRPFDVLLQDELCRPALSEHNDHLTQPSAVVALVHYLRSADPGVENAAQVRERERQYLDSLDGAICTSQYTCDRTRAVASLPTLVAPPAGRHEGAAISRETVRARAQTDPLQIVFVGNLIPRKGASTLLAALDRVDRDWRLTVVGSHDADPAHATRVRDRVESLGVADRVTFLGRVDDDTLAEMYRRSHVLAVPSRCEPFGMVYLEGMEYGVVPIATRVGGAREFVTDGQNGVLVDPTDADEIATRGRALATERDRLARLGIAALETAADHPTWDETMAAVRSFLREMATNTTPASGDATTDDNSP